MLGMGKRRPTQRGRNLGLFQAAQRLCLGLRLLPPFQTCLLCALKAQRSPAFRLTDTKQWGSPVPILPAGCKCGEGGTTAGSALTIKSGLEGAPQTQTDLDAQV